MTELIPYIVKGIQEQNQIIAQQTTQLTSQATEISTLKEQMATILAKLS